MPNPKTTTPPKTTKTATTPPPPPAPAATTPPPPAAPAATTGRKPARSTAPYATVAPGGGPPPPTSGGNGGNNGGNNTPPPQPDADALLAALVSLAGSKANADAYADGSSGGNATVLFPPGTHLVPSDERFDISGTSVAEDGSVSIFRGTGLGFPTFNKVNAARYTQGERQADYGQRIAGQQAARNNAANQAAAANAAATTGTTPPTQNWWGPVAALLLGGLLIAALAGGFKGCDSGPDKSTVAALNLQTLPDGKVAVVGPDGKITVLPAGASGDTGAKGDKGDKGDTGAQGPQGFQGNPGPQGIQGPAGFNGSNGTAGSRGRRGRRGRTGTAAPTPQAGTPVDPRAGQPGPAVADKWAVALNGGGHYEVDSRAAAVELVRQHRGATGSICRKGDCRWENAR